MRISTRILLFVLTNIAIIATVSVVFSVLGIEPYLNQYGINYQSLAIFCLIWGFGASFISLALSRKMAKWMMGVKVIDPRDPSAKPHERWLVDRVHTMARAAHLSSMPEVGIYENDEVNAFATGPSKSRSLVAVSTGLLHTLEPNEVDGVLGHEVAHIANGDMVTMTLIQGVVNAFVMFIARIAAFGISQTVREESRWMVQLGCIIVFEIAFGILGSLITSAFSRRREFRADQGGANLSGKENMIQALSALKRTYDPEAINQSESALASLKISGKSVGWIKWFSTHPPLDERINALRANT